MLPSTIFPVPKFIYQFVYMMTNLKRTFNKKYWQLLVGHIAGQNHRPVSQVQLGESVSTNKTKTKPSIDNICSRQEFSND